MSEIKCREHSGLLRARICAAATRGSGMVLDCSSHVPYPPCLCLQACSAHTRQLPFPTGETYQAGRKRLLVVSGECLGAGERYTQGMLSRMCSSPLRCARAVTVLNRALSCAVPDPTGMLPECR